MKSNPEELKTRWFLGEASPEDVELLEMHLMECSAHRTQFLKECQLEVVLRDDALDASLKAWKSDSRHSPQAPSPSRNKLLWLSAATLSCFSLAWFLLLPADRSGSHLHEVKLAIPSTGDSPAELEDAAILTNTINAKWSSTQERIQPGDILRAGVMKLDEGMAQLEFYEGATVLLEGPALFEVVSASEGILHQGRARVHIPSPAHDFRLRSKDLMVISEQGEFGVNLDTKGGEHEFLVFEGTAKLVKGGLLYHQLSEGDRLEVSQDLLAKYHEGHASKFVSAEDFEHNQYHRASLRFGEWKNWITQAKQDHRLLALFPFGRTKVGERELCNSVEDARPYCNGGIVGAKWTQGRWPNKDALEFRRPGDRVRLELDGHFDRITFSCWVKVDSLDRQYHGILLTDGFEHGEPHWQVSKEGRVLLSIADESLQRSQPLGETFSSPVIFSKSHLGRWHHLAVSYDRVSGEVKHYVDGKEVSISYPSEGFSRPSIVLGRCELGNWGRPHKGAIEPIRNLNGCLDEFSIYKTVLNQKEIRQIFEAGKQD